MEAPKILIIEDEPDILEIFESAFEEEDFEIFLCSSYEEGEAHINKGTQFVAVISDLNLKAKSGVDLLVRAKQINSGTLTILTTGSCSPEVPKSKFYEVFYKPFDFKDIVTRTKDFLGGINEKSN